MISKGDLVLMRLSLGGDSDDGGLRETIMIGKVLNYCDEEENYIFDPLVISISKEQVAEIEALPADFDFNDVSMGISMAHEKFKHDKPPEITDIRFSRER